VLTRNDFRLIGCIPLAGPSLNAPAGPTSPRCWDAKFCNPRDYAASPAGGCSTLHWCPRTVSENR